MHAAAGGVAVLPEVEGVEAGEGVKASRVYGVLRGLAWPRLLSVAFIVVSCAGYVVIPVSLTILRRWT
jgi:hypothetical protein